jgi:hypothetical protein
VADSQVLLVVGLLLVVVGLVGVAAKFFGAELGVVTGRSRVVATLLGLAVLAAWMWAPLPGTRDAAGKAGVQDYQARVLATCADIRGQTYGEGLIFDGRTWDRDGLAQLLKEQITFHQVAWSRLWQNDVPKPLREKQAVAQAHVDEFLVDARTWQKSVQKYKRERISNSRYKALATQAGVLDSASQATASITDLAGQSCQVATESN